MQASTTRECALSNGGEYANRGRIDQGEEGDSRSKGKESGEQEAAILIQESTLNLILLLIKRNVYLLLFDLLFDHRSLKYNWIRT